METELITPYHELVSLIKDKGIFYFCVAFALNKGYRNTLKEKKEVKFSFGDYEVKMDWEHGCFTLIHKEYFARIITAYMEDNYVMAMTEEEVIEDLLKELAKEFPETFVHNPLEKS